MLAALSLPCAPACGGSGGETDGDTSTGGPGTTADATVAGTTTGTGDGTTGAPEPTTAADPTPDGTSTTGPDSDTTADPTPGTTSETGTDTGDTDTGGNTSTGGFDPADIPVIPPDDAPTSDRHKKVPIGTTDAKVGYWEYVPPGYGGGEKYPLMVFLHGIGENGPGDDMSLDKVPLLGPPNMIKQNTWPEDLPFIVLSPQHPGGGCPSPTEVHDFIAYATEYYDVNPGRVYLTGLSCGAVASWNYLAEHLDSQIVAMVPIAGDGKGAFNKAGCDLGKVPLWAFHGDADDVVPVSSTTSPIMNLQMCDPKPEAEVVVYPGVGHDSWTMTYNLAAGHDIYAWMLEHYRP